MRFVWSTAVKDWRRRWRNPLEIFMWIGIPLVVGLLIALAFGGRGGPRPQAHVLVADNDESFLSRFLVGALSQEAAGGFVRAESVGEADGRAQMNKGKATALIVIPQGFSLAVLREKPAALILVTNPSETILPGMVEEALSILIDGTFYLHRLAGEDLRAFAEGPPSGANTFPDETIAAVSTRMNRLVERVHDYVSPLAMKLETSVDAPQGEKPDFGILLLPSILFMALLFMASGLGDDLWEERNRKTLRRVAVSPQHMVSILLGKTLCGAALVFIVSAVALAIGYAYIKPPLGTLPIALVWATLSGVMLFSLMTTIQLFATSQRAGNILSLAIVFPLMMAGGSFFPFEVMPAWMAEIGKRTPNGWALERLKDVVLGRASAGDLLASFGVLAAVCVLLFAVCADRLKRRFAQG